MMAISRLDQLYRSLLLTKFFTRGWGKPDNLKRLFEFRKILSNRETCQHLVAADYPINVDKEYRDGDCRILEGHFLSPFVHHLPGIMPKEVETATFQMLLPVHWRHPVLKPVCIHLAGTGDHYFWRRRLFTARPLLKEAGIASILLENPYYGSRKPKQQLRSSLQNVSDLFVMGGALVLESLALLHWCEREGLGPLGLSGVSMGGHMLHCPGRLSHASTPRRIISLLIAFRILNANSVLLTARYSFTAEMASGAATVWPKPVSVVPILSWTTASIIFTEMASLAATNWTKPISLIPCLSWSTASCVFTEGVMSGAIPWKTLQEQFFENSVYHDEIKKLIISPEDNRRRAYDIGQQFVKDYSQSIKQVEILHKEHEQHIPQGTPSNSLSDHKSFESARHMQQNMEKSISYSQLQYSRGADVNNNSTFNSVSNNSSPRQECGNSLQESFLTANEYLERVKTPQSFREENDLSQPVSPSSGASESILSVMASTSGTALAKASVPSSSQPLFPSLTSAAAKKEHLSILLDSSVSENSNCDRQQNRLKNGVQSLPLSFAKGKHSQQHSKMVTSSSDPKTTLSLKHALAKSKLIMSRQPASTLSTNDEHQKILQHDALDFMRGVMDECTHLGNFSVPVDPELIIIVSARQDAYVPRKGVMGLDQLWPGCEVRYVDQGHVGAVLLHQSVFRKAIVDAFDRQVKKYCQTPESKSSQSHQQN